MRRLSISGGRNLIALGILVLSIGSGCTKSVDTEEIRALDATLTQVGKYQKKAEEAAEMKVAKALATTDPEEKIKNLMEASDSYRYLDLQKSLELLSEARVIAQSNTDSPYDSIKIILKIASLYNSEGMMVKEAYDIFQKIKPERLNKETLNDYYVLGVQINKKLADRSIDRNLRLRYTNEAAKLRDSVLKLDPHNSIIAANQFLEVGKNQEALALMLSSESELKENGGRQGPYYHNLARIYGVIGNKELQTKYLAMAATDDLRHGIRDYKALQELAELIYKEDVRRAFKYISRSQTDAETSHSSMRLQEIAPVYMVINSSKILRERQIFVGGLILMSTAFVVLIFVSTGIVLLKRKNRQLILSEQNLKVSNAKIEQTNSELENTNTILKKESEVKEFYIQSFMDLCLSYLAKMEHFRASLGKIASGGDIKKITSAINSSRYVNLEISEFYERFDKAFFSLYPDFIKKLNGLLKEEHYYPQKERLSTDLRVYALIWLGIEQSGEISKFLRCSESTVYNYRTQMRNKAKDRDNFESDFINLRK